MLESKQFFIGSTNTRIALDSLEFGSRTDISIDDQRALDRVMFEGLAVEWECCNCSTEALCCYRPRIFIKKSTPTEDYTKLVNELTPEMWVGHPARSLFFWTMVDKKTIDSGGDLELVPRIGNQKGLIANHVGTVGIESNSPTQWKKLDGDPKYEFEYIGSSQCIFCMKYGEKDRKVVFKAVKRRVQYPGDRDFYYQYEYFDAPEITLSCNQCKSSLRTVVRVVSAPCPSGQDCAPPICDVDIFLESTGGCFDEGCVGGWHLLGTEYAPQQVHLELRIT